MREELRHGLPWLSGDDPHLVQSLLEPRAPPSCPQVDRAITIWSQTLCRVASLLQLTPQFLHLLLIVPASQLFL